MTKGRDVVFWSGGMDSTLIAVRLLRERKQVTLCTFTNPNIGGDHQQNMEQIKRKRIIQRMITEFGEHQINYETFTWDGPFRLGNVLGQASVWCSMFPAVAESEDRLYFGAIEYSHFWHRKEKFENAINAVLDMHDKKNITIKYPLEWMSKKSVKKELKKYGYLDACFHSDDNNKKFGA